jgi:hypothetical protein
MSEFQSTLDRVVGSLKEILGTNLHSCCLYGSAVRGDAIAGVSDINLLIVLGESTAEAHLAVRKVIASDREIDPFVLGRRGLERSVRAFAPKFLSIQRNYRVLYGTDPLAEVRVEPQLERFLCEQALRNLRLRLAFVFIKHAQNRDYSQFIARMATPLLLRFSEILRLDGKELPKELEARIPMLARDLGINEQLLRDLLAFKKQPKKLPDDEVIAWHERLFPAVDKAVTWMETKWPA